MTIIFNIVLLTNYWGFLHSHEVKKHLIISFQSECRIAHLYMIHTIPGLSCLANSIVTNAILKSSLWSLIFTSVVVFFFLQFYLVVGLEY